MNRSMSKQWVCGIWAVWLAAMVLCLGTLPGVAIPDEREVAEETDEATVLPLAVAPFDAAAAKAHQEAWATHLGVPVEVTNSIGMKLLLVPPGEFMRRSPKEENDEEIETRNMFGMPFSGSKPPLAKREPPQHRVRITTHFCLGMYEVTQSQWESVMGSNPSRFKVPDHPVETVSWEDCQEFIRRLNDLPAERGNVYRLPTEAEWEYACRAGSTTVYSFGDSENSLGDYAWYSRNSNRSTHPVGQQRPNAWGLHDMHGNVWEWCQDWYDSGYYASSPTDDPQGPAAGSYRVHRGGSWYDTARDCRSANRSRYQPSIRYNILGFRLVRSSVE